MEDKLVQGLKERMLRGSKRTYWSGGNCIEKITYCSIATAFKGKRTFSASKSNSWSIFAYSDGYTVR